MPSRQIVKTIVTPVEIMGQDAWVKIKKITVDEAKELQTLGKRLDTELNPIKEELYKAYKTENNITEELTDEQKAIAVMGSEVLKKAEDFFYNYYSKYVIDWNWVTEKTDDNGDSIPMEKPFNNPKVFGMLTSEEFSYLQSLFQTDETNEKN